MDHLSHLGGKAVLSDTVFWIYKVCLYNRFDFFKRKKREEFEILFDICIRNFQEVLQSNRVMRASLLLM